MSVLLERFLLLLLLLLLVWVWEEENTMEFELLLLLSGPPAQVLVLLVCNDPFPAADA